MKRRRQALKTRITYRTTPMRYRQVSRIENGQMYMLPRTSHLASSKGTTRQSANLYWLFFVLYAVFALYFYFSTIKPYLASGDVYGPRLLADAITYEAICTIEREFFDFATLRDIGPCLGLWIFSYSSGFLSVLNATLIILSVAWLANVYERPWRPMLALVLINPVVFASIFGANKEVFGFTSFAMLAIFVRSGSVFALVICLFTALFTRLPAFVITAAFCLLLITGLPRAGRLSINSLQRYWLLIVGILVVTTVIAVLYGRTLEDSLLGDFSRAEDISRSTEFSLSLDALSTSGLYVVVYILRLMLNLYSGVIGLTNLIRGEGANYYTVAVVGSSAVFIVLSIRLALCRLPEDLSRTSDAWNMILFAIFMTAFLCLSPVIQHRYFLSIYVLLVLFSFKRRAEPLRCLNQVSSYVCSGFGL